MTVLSLYWESLYKENGFIPKEDPGHRLIPNACGLMQSKGHFLPSVLSLPNCE